MSILFTPQTIKNIEIKNRFVRSATYEGMASEDWGPSQAISDLYAELADGEVGLIMTGGTFIRRHKTFDVTCGAPIPLAMDEDSCIEGWPEIIDRVHKYGTKVVMQLANSGRKDSPELLGRTPPAPSDILDRDGNLEARAMSVEEIREYIEEFAQACRRTKLAGFDGAQLHGGHGFLISSSISPFTNRRTDQYGGSTENRARFIVEIVERARELVGSDYPLIIKMNCDDFVPGGIEPEEAGRIAKIIVEAGIDCIEVTGGVPESGAYIMRLDRSIVKGTNTEKNEAYFRNMAAAIKKSVNVPIILVGGMRSPGVMEGIIQSGIADFVSLCRPLICEPQIIKKWKSGDMSRSKCVSCMQCLMNVFIQPLKCHAKLPPTTK